MASTFKGYDPELGRKFSEESNGLVIGRPRSSARKSEEQVIQEYVDEHGRAPDAQQLHDAMLASSPAQGATPEELEEMASRKRWTVGRNQGLAAQASKADAASSKDS